MIKVQGFGRRRGGTSHEDCVRHHREIHSKLGLAQGDHMGKYVLYYFEMGFAGDGSPLAELPWDMSALEWYTDHERWHNFQDWLEKAPDGQEVKTDEATFLQRERCYLLPYDEAIVANEPAGDAINMFRILTANDRVSAQSLREWHAARCVPAVRAAFGGALRAYVANHITEATSLATGRIPDKPFDIVEMFKFDPAGGESAGELARRFAADGVAAAEDGTIARGKTVILSAEEVAYIP